jgi:hypothetical protein
MNNFVEDVRNLLVSSGFSSALLGAKILDGVYSVYCGNGWIEVSFFGIYANYVSVNFVGCDGSIIEYGACYNNEQLSSVLSKHMEIAEVINDTP